MKRTPKTARKAERRARNMKARAIRIARERGWKVEEKSNGQVVIRR